MDKKEEIKQFNMYLLPIFLGVIVFLQVNIVPSGNDQEKILQIYGINIFTLVFLGLSSILIYVMIPKKNTLLKIINKFKKEKWSDEDINNKSTKVNENLSYFIYYIFAILLSATFIVGIFVFRDLIQ